MGYSELKNWEAVFFDTTCIRTMMYLAKYNPGKQAEEIKAKLEISSEDLEKAINKLLSAQMLIVKDDSFTLKDSALVALDNFLQLAKE